jgi:hypothetical protein
MIRIYFYLNEAQIMKKTKKETSISVPRGAKDKTVRIEEAENGWVINCSYTSGDKYIDKRFIATSEWKAKSMAAKLLRL